MSREPMDADDLVDAMKAAAWERAKGALREVAILAGSHKPDYGNSREPLDESEFIRIDGLIERFIKRFEENGFNQ